MAILRIKDADGNVTEVLALRGEPGKSGVLTVNGIGPDENGNVNVEGGGGSGGIAKETDPTVPAWAKQPTKPTYTAAEVGAMAANTPVVKSVNGTTPDVNGNVTVEFESGVSDYTELNNKPSINGVELSGNKTSADLGIGNPTDEQVAASVEAWLDAHPEATTTVADGSITESKLADGAVSAQKTDFIRFDGTSANLFNKATVTEGYELEGYNATKVNASFCISDYIPVEAGVKYFHTYKGGRHIHYLDSAKAFISGTMVYGNFTTPANCAYIRIELPISEKDEWMVVKGDALPKEYIPYVEYYTLAGRIGVTVENIKDLEALFASAPDGSIAESALSEMVQAKLSDERINNAVGWNDVRQSTKTLTGRINVFEKAIKGVFDIASDISQQTVIVHGVNYFDKKDLVLGEIKNGVISASTTTYYTEHLIPVQPTKKLFWNRNNADGVRSYIMFHFYGQNQEWLRSKVIGGVNVAGFFAPEDDVYFIRVQCGNLVDADTEKLCVADVDIGNTAYGGYEGCNGIEITSATPYFGKNVFFPYIGYRIENGVLVGTSDTYTVEEITHVDVFDPVSTIEVTAPVEGFDKERLRNVVLKYGRHGDTDYVMARIFKNTITGDTITPKVIAITPGGKTMEVLAGESDFVMCINAGIFDMTDNSCLGTTIVDGVVVTDHNDSATCGLSDTLCVDKNGNFVSYPYATTTADMLAAGVTQAVQGWCTIIDNYLPTDIAVKTEEVSLPDEVNTVLTAKHPRTAVGQYKNGDYFVYICGGRETNQAGVTCEEMQTLFVAEGVKYAYNLDGGGSCNMMFFKKELAPYTENRADPSYIVFT